MDTKSFKDLVNEKAPEHLKNTHFLNSAIFDLLLAGEPLEKFQISKVIQQAGKYYNEYQPETIRTKGSGGEGKALFPPTSYNILSSEKVLEKLSPWVERMREANFRKKTPPFNSAAEAREWLEKTSLEIKEKLPEGRQKAISDIMQLANSYSIDLGYSWRFRQKALPFPGENGNIEYYPVYPENYLDWLESETAEKAEATGFSQCMLVCYILVGSPKPLMEKFSIMPLKRETNVLPGPGEEKISRWFLSVNISTGDLTFDELRDLYRESRKALGVKYRHGIKEKHRELYMLVKKMGGPPIEEKGKFWNKVLQEWQKMYDEGHSYYIETPNGCRKIFRDTEKKLQT